MAKVQKLCGAVLPNLKSGPDFECEREQGHQGKHSSLGVQWTDCGAERLREERRKQIEAEPF
jgi:hypothetical protein